MTCEKCPEVFVGVCQAGMEKNEMAQCLLSEPESRIPGVGVWSSRRQVFKEG